MATYRLDHTFECDGELACRYCTFWHYDDIDGWCLVTCTHEWGQHNFDCYEERLPDCPLTEVER